MTIFLQVSFLIFTYMCIAFLLALAKKDNSIVDVFWGLGFLIIAGFSLFISGVIDLHKVLINLAVLTWSLRLSIHILIRNLGRGEDFRYKVWRDTWKHFVLRSFFQIFMFQGLLMLIISLPIFFANTSLPVNVGLSDYLGMMVFMAGFIFETIGDYQLKAFKKDSINKGKIMTKGLWSITRHPNYFGESLIWWGIALLALDCPGGWITLISPVVLTLLLRFVSGVPMLEQKYKGRSDWEAYKKKTAIFVPYLKFS